MEIRQGTLEELPVVAKEIKLEIESYDPESFSKSVSRIIGAGGKYWLLEDERGIAGVCVGMIVPHICNHSRKIAKRLFLEVLDEHKDRSGELMKAFDEWALDNGAEGE